MRKFGRTTLKMLKGSVGRHLSWGLGLVTPHSPSTRDEFVVDTSMHQRVQIDVKFVLSCCLLNEAKGKRFYQYTAIDEYSRWRYVEAFEEHSTYSSARFLEHLTQRCTR